MGGGNATSAACLATCTCVVSRAVWALGLPAQLTIHMVVPVAHAHRAASSWLHDGVARGSLDCSDIEGEARVWSLRPFDPLPVELTAEADAEILLLLANRVSLRHPLAPCVAVSAEGLARRGVHMRWHGSYRAAPPPILLRDVLRVLSLRSAVVLGSGLDGGAPSAGSASSSRSAATTRLLRDHGVERRRMLALTPRASHQRRAQGGDAASASNGREVMRFAAALAAEPFEVALQHQQVSA